jgi:hypothetical protein
MKTAALLDEKTLEVYRSWFKSYVRSFYSSDKEIHPNIVLKEKHTQNVCSEIRDIGASLDLNTEQLVLAEIIALFHDIGRFQQYKKYRTFSDQRSEDHALLGIKVLKQESILDGLDQSHKDLIYWVISCHNMAKIPETEDPECVFFSRLLRDADKLDIWNIVIHYYENREAANNNALVHNLPDVPVISDSVKACVLAREYVSFDDLRTLNDYKLLQMSWIFDVNFPRTFEVIQERHYMEKIRDVLNLGSEQKEVYAVVRAFLEERLKYINS